MTATAVKNAKTPKYCGHYNYLFLAFCDCLQCKCRVTRKLDALFYFLWNEKNLVLFPEEQSRLFSIWYYCFW